MLPKISIITASYNQGEFLEKTILSVLDQKYPNLEYIIIDGGSTDNSVEIIKKYEKNLAYWVSEKDDGQYHAINKGFSKCTGDILAFLNADDLYLPWTLKTVASIFTECPGVEWLTSLIPSQINAEGIITSHGKVNPISKKAFLEGYYIPATSSPFGVIIQEGTFWRKSLWQKAGSEINLKRTLAGDFDLWCKFLQYTEPYCFGLPLAVMTRHKNQRSNSMALYVKECYDSLHELRDKLSYSVGNEKLQQFKNKLFRSNKLLWMAGKRILNYKAMVVDPVFEDDNYTLKWKIKNFMVYMKN